MGEKGPFCFICSVGINLFTEKCKKTKVSIKIISYGCFTKYTVCEEFYLHEILEIGVLKLMG